MDVFTAIKERRSCRNYSPDPVSEEAIEQILEAGMWAPSPLNSQPWQFIVVTNDEVKEKIVAEAERCRNWAIDASGWGWLEKYKVGFLKSVPVMIVVVGDPKGTGVDQFQEEGSMGYQQACAFDKQPLREILGIEAEKAPLAVLCLGKPAGEAQQMGRKDLEKKVKYVR
jgi:nitroreductase